MAHTTILAGTDMSTATPKVLRWELDPITARSFAIVEDELRGTPIDPSVFPIVRRVIHATADFDFAQVLRFHPQAIRAGLESLQAGGTIVTDVRMVEVGMNQRVLQALGNKTVCLVHEAGVARTAMMTGATRAAVALRQAAEVCRDGGIFVIGSAPTALFALVRLVEERRVHPALIVGVPVGVVGAAESKDALMRIEHTPWIASHGRKGGSAVAVAIVNALLLLAVEQEVGRQ